MSDILLILNETLEDLAKRIKEHQATIERDQNDLEEAKKAAEGLGRIRKCKDYEDEQVKRKITTLKSYLTQFEVPPRALVEKMQALSNEAERTSQASFQAGQKADHALDLLRDRETNLSVLKQESVDLQQQWDEITALIAKAK